MSRQYIYKVDKFVKKLGYGKELVSYLELRHEITHTDNKIISRIFATYPSTMQRIDILENS
jgi:hypothetical protein